MAVSIGNDRQKVDKRVIGMEFSDEDRSLENVYNEWREYSYSLLCDDVDAVVKDATGENNGQYFKCREAEAWEAIATYARMKVEMLSEVKKDGKGCGD